MSAKLKIRTLPVGQMQANCYLLTDPENLDTVIVDPGDDADYIQRVISDNQLHPVGIVATHGHFDHVMAVLETKLAYSIPFMMHQKDEFLLAQMQSSVRKFLGIEADPPAKPDAFIGDGQEIQAGRYTLKSIHSPGHTPGSICLYSETSNILLTGDVLFAGGGVGRTDFSYSRPLELIDSIHRLFRLPHETFIYPGHGNTSTIGEERKLHESR